MTNYVFQATSSSGNRALREVQAASAANARRMLQAEGCTEIELFEDEIGAATAQQFEQNVTVLGEPLTVTASDRFKYRDRTSPSVGRALWDGAWQSKGLIAFMLVVIAWLIFCEHYKSAIVGVISIAAWILFLVGVSLPLIYYNKLHRAVDWNRWDEVLNLVGKLEANRKINFIKVPEAELARNRAKALAGLGRLEEGLACYQKYADTPGCPSWLHKALTAGLYDTAKQYDMAIEYTRLSMAEKDYPAMHSDQAYRYARHKRDAANARQSLNEAEKAEFSKSTRPFLLRARGMVCYLENNDPEARRAFEEALDGMERTRNEPFRDGSIGVTKAHLACVLARQGELELARKHFADATPYLNATKQMDLLAECRTLGLQ